LDVGVKIFKSKPPPGKGNRHFLARCCLSSW